MDKASLLKIIDQAMGRIRVTNEVPVNKIELLYGAARSGQLSHAVCTPLLRLEDSAITNADRVRLLAASRRALYQELLADGDAGLPLTDAVATSDLLGDLPRATQEKISAAFSRGDDIRAVLSGLDIGSEASRSYALIIGINSYPRLGPDRCLAGAENDARAHALTLRAMGVPAENILVLFSESRPDEALRCDVIAHGRHPARLTDMSNAQLNEISAGPIPCTADHSGIALGVRWLNAMLHAAGSDSQGFIFFSGHGSIKDGFPAICPSSISPGPVEAAELMSLRDIFSDVVAAGTATELDAATNLTVVLDMCLTPINSHRYQPPRIETPLKTSFDSAGLRDGDVVLMSSDFGEASLEGVFDNRWHGAFSWALSTVLQQFSVKVSSSGRAYDIDYGELIERARLLLSALGYGQRASSRLTTHSSQSAALWPVFGHSAWSFQEADTIASVKLAEELDGGTNGHGIFYEIRSLTPTPGTLGYLISTRTALTINEGQGSDEYSCDAGREYWFWNSASMFPASFVLKPITQLPPTIEINHRGHDTSKDFPTTSSAAVPAGAYIIEKLHETDTAVPAATMGYMMKSASTLDWYRAVAAKMKVSAPYVMRFSAATGTLPTGQKTVQDTLAST